MDTVLPTRFECVACGFEHPAGAVQYDDLGYPVCPACGARTGPLAGGETDDPASVAD
jgi:transcription elongation factor Elf1